MSQRRALRWKLIEFAALPGRLDDRLGITFTSLLALRNHALIDRVAARFSLLNREQKLVSKTQNLSFYYSTQPLTFQSAPGLAGGAVGLVFERQLVLDRGDFAVPDADLI